MAAPYSPKQKQRVNLSDNTPYTVNRYAFELDGIRHAIGICTKASGGDVTQEVIAAPVGNQYHNTRYAGRPRFNDIEVHLTAVSSAALWEWIKASLDNKPHTRDGTIIEYDARHRERWRRHFHNGLISSIQFPTLDSSSSA